MGVSRMLRDMALSEFTDRLASFEPAPGGGSASAAVSALGASLLVMTCNFTIGKDGHREAEGDLLEVREELESLRVWLLTAIDRDSTAYDAVTTALRMPKGTPDERAARREAVQVAMRAAAEVPMDVARRSARALDLGVVVAELGNPNTISDTGCGARFLEAGLRGALYNVGINLASIKDEGYVRTMSEDAEGLMVRGLSSLERIVQRVEAITGP